MSKTIPVNELAKMEAIIKSEPEAFTVEKLIELKDWLDKQPNIAPRYYPVPLSKKTIKRFRDAGCIDFTDEQIDKAEEDCTPLFYCEGCAVYVDPIVKKMWLTEKPLS